MNSRGRSFCFTLNNYTEEELNELRRFAQQCKYMILGYEVAPETGTPHIQGYFQLNHGKTFSAIKHEMEVNGVAWRAHIEKARGSPHSNFEYCSKGENFEEFGTRPKGQGHRTDLERVAEMIKDKKELKAIVEENPVAYIKYSRGINELYNLIGYSEKRDWPTKVYWIYGPTGCGKTRFIHEKTKDYDPYWKTPDTKWFCGYNGQAVVIMDDFRPSKELSFAFLLKLFDRYPVTVEGKGRGYEVSFVAQIIFVSTPRNVKDTYADFTWIGNEQIAQLERRVTQVDFGSRTNIARYCEMQLEELINN